MKLINPSPVSFQRVLESYYGSHGDQNAYEVRVLTEANSILGFWTNASIPMGEVGRIILPGHIEKSSGHVVIPSQGEELGRAYERLLVEERADYQSKTLACSRKVMTQKEIMVRSGPRTFFLSMGPFSEFSTYYANIQESITNAESRLVHLDGLHGLLALMDLPEESKPKIVRTCIAHRHREL